MAKSKGYNPIRKGHDPRTEKRSTQNNVQWLKLNDGDTVDATALIEANEILVADQCAIWLDSGNSPIWVYCGPEDPSHDLGVERRYKAFLPLLLDSGDIVVFSFGKSVHRQIMDIAEATGELKGLELRFKRTGKQLNTRYSIVNRAKRHDVSKIEPVDVVSMLGPLTVEGIRDMIAEKLNKESYEDVLAAYNGAFSKRKTSPVANVAKLNADEDDEEEEEEEEVVRPPKKAKAKPKAKPVVVEEDDEEEDDDDLDLELELEDDDE